MTRARFEGVYTALVTPFRDDRVDEDALRALVEAQISGGVHGLVPLGTTGESVTMTREELSLVLRTVVAAARGRVPVVAGAGTNATRTTIELCALAKEHKADGVLLVTPYYNKPTTAGLVAHYRAVLGAVSIPAMLYNVPGRTAVDMGIEVLDELQGISDIVAIKEATGNVIRTQTILSRFGDRFAVLAGDDALTLPVLAVGGHGVVSVTSNRYPRAVSTVVDRFRAGDLAGARAAHLALVPVHDAMFVETNPGPVKFSLADAGRIAPEVRLPLAWPTASSQEKIRGALKAAGIAG